MPNVNSCFYSKKCVTAIKTNGQSRTGSRPQVELICRAILLCPGRWWRQSQEVAGTFRGVLGLYMQEAKIEWTNKSKRLWCVKSRCPHEWKHVCEVCTRRTNYRSSQNFAAKATIFWRAFYHNWIYLCWFYSEKPYVATTRKTHPMLAIVAITYIWRQYRGRSSGSTSCVSEGN